MPVLFQPSNLPTQVIGFRIPSEIDFRIKSSIDGVYNFFSSRLNKIGTDGNGNFFTYETHLSKPPTEECILSNNHKKIIREIMKKNLKKNPDDKEWFKIVFSYCKGNSGIKLVEDYKNDLDDAVKKNLDMTDTDKDKDSKVMFNPAKPKEESGIIKKEDQQKKLDAGWEFVKKYNKTDSNVTKIKVYLNNDEYKEIPYQGTITDDYHKILFTSSFDIFPTKKLKIKN